ncbi:MAG: hypothetical protein FD181_2486 [Prolixibacteraceae bacterium]|nr:MAG: hypothetical protein FD181_2486 [Prolixibacteraceae bacterium]
MNRISKSVFFAGLLFFVTLSVWAQQNRRFFSDDSFWNQPLPENPKIHPKSDKWIAVLSKEPGGAYFGINTNRYTIPVYEADKNTPVHTIYHRPVNDHFKKVHGYKNGWFDKNEFYGHGKGFGRKVPIPANAISDPEEDSHIVVVDWTRNLIWDVWGLEIIDGKYHSFTGMKYKANGPGVFKTSDFKVKNGESIHFFGPGRAAGVPVVAGLILYDEAMRGEINHKLAIATRHNAYQEFVFPATWTDGILHGGIPEGSVIQLDPALDLSKFELTPQEKAVAVAAQKYGMVIVDQSGANVIYAQGLYKTSPVNWEGKLRGWTGGINGIPIHHYRVLETGPVQKGGLYSEELDKAYFKIDHEKLMEIME